MHHVSRIGRTLDLVGLLMFLAGAALYIRAWIGFRSVPDFQRSPGGQVMAAVQYAEGFVPFQRAGVTLMLCALIVFLAAWWRERRGTDPPAAP